MKSKFIIVTKADMLHAARTEPLTFNAWFDSYMKGYDQCPACAVGSSLRVATRKVRGCFDLKQTNYACATLTGNRYTSKQKFRRGRPNWLSRMSMFWEELGEGEVIRIYGQSTSLDKNTKIAETLRPQLIAWIEANVPENYKKKILMETYL